MKPSFPRPFSAAVMSHGKQANKQTDARKETEHILGLVSAHVVAMVLATKDKMSCRIGKGENTGILRTM